MAVDPKDGYIFAYTQDQGQVGWTEKKKPGVEYSFDEHGSPLEYTRAGVDGPGPFHTFTAPVKPGDRAAGNLAVPETTVGTSDSGECEYRRVRMAGSVRNHRRAGAATSRIQAGLEASRVPRRRPADWCLRAL